MGSRSVIVAAMDTVRRAEDALHATVEREFPAGTTITWIKGRNAQHGIVVEHGWLGRLQVVNSKTNATRWINCSDITTPQSDGWVEHG